MDTGQSLALLELSPVTGVGSNNPTLSPDGTKVLFREALHGSDPYDWAKVVPIAGGNLQKFKMPVSAGEVGAFILYGHLMASRFCSPNVQRVSGTSGQCRLTAKLPGN
jgi:hypothetical protein